jgi:hypothetical protein
MSFNISIYADMDSLGRSGRARGVYTRLNNET